MAEVLGAGAAAARVTVAVDAAAASAAAAAIILFVEVFAGALLVRGPDIVGSELKSAKPLVVRVTRGNPAS